MLGRPFLLLIEGPVPPGRFEVRVWEGRLRGRAAQQYLRAPIRGRDAEEARDRALDVLRTYVGLDQFRLVVEDAARELAPGARVGIKETAREVIVSVDAPRGRPRPPLAVGRELIVGSKAGRESLRALVRAYLQDFDR